MADRDYFWLFLFGRHFLNHDRLLRWLRLFFLGGFDNHDLNRFGRCFRFFLRNRFFNRRLFLPRKR